MKLSPIKKRMAEAFEPILSKIDEKAKDIVMDLVKRMNPYTRFEELHRDDRDAPLCTTFHTANGSNVMVIVKGPNDEPSNFNAAATSVGHNQFRTHGENLIYCEGTKDLLWLLSEYRSIRTEKALVMSAPSSRIAGGPEGGPHQAYINVGHLRTHYGKERSVNVLILSEEGCVIFKFEEQAHLGKMPPWLSPDEEAA